RLQQAAVDEAGQSASADAPERAAFGRALRGAARTPGLAEAQKAFDAAAKPAKEADEALRLARARVVNADAAEKDAERTLARSRSWSLYRTSDLALSLDAGQDVVRAAAPAVYGRLALDQTIPDGGAAVATLTGPLAAAALDAQGRLVRQYATDADVDKALPSWSLVYYHAGGDVEARLSDDVVRTKVRLSHYETTVTRTGIDPKTGRPTRASESLPVLLSERYLIARLDASRSKLSTDKHWAIMPYNWGNIVLEVPRGIAQAPFELAGGRDPRWQHYLGRAAMHKTEGGETEHHGFFRTVLGWVDVLDLLPDPVTPAFDPSQMPGDVRVASPLKPGEILAQKDARDPSNGRDVHFGSLAMEAQVRRAAEDLDAARQRTLARFNGGIEQTYIETRRGRAGDYEETSVAARSGDVSVDGKPVSVVAQSLRQDPTLAADPGANGRGDIVMSATPHGLFVDRVERRVRIYPGAAGYASEAAAMGGYRARVGTTAKGIAAARPGLEAAQARDKALVAENETARKSVEAREQKQWARVREEGLRLGVQQELERRIAALRARIRAETAELAWWAGYAGRLERAPGGVTPVPTPPTRPNPSFWVWFFSLFGLGALLSLAWSLLRGRLPRGPRPA
ncbi:MAG: hypothetical protein KGM24_09150, partial [Elusimicrobia bacterium]|nr:hypothetical protein [Elusimicrobiota bacterium]